jgi:hypothetical protein
MKLFTTEDTEDAEKVGNHFLRDSVLLGRPFDGIMISGSFGGTYVYWHCGRSWTDNAD